MKYCPSCTKLVNFTKNGEDVICDDCKAIIPSLVKPVNAQAPLTPEQSDIHTAHIAAEVANTSDPSGCNTSLQEQVSAAAAAGAGRQRETDYSLEADSGLR